MWLRVLFGAVITLLTWITVFGQDVGTEVDISWDFNTRDREGWANATSEEMGMQVRIESGELRSTILSWNPHLDSPVMLIPTTRRHFVVFRMMYFGSATKANLLLKYGPSVGHQQHYDELKANWQARLPVTIASASSGQETAEYAVDASPHSAWTATQSRGAWIILDLGDYRWISKLRIRSSGETSAPRRCFLQKSQTSGAGPFITVVSFTLEFTLDEQIVEGFDGHARFWRLFVVDNYNDTTISVRDIGLEGNDEGVASLPFALDNSGKFKNYYLPIYTVLQGSLARMRLQIQHDIYSGKVTGRARPTFREALAIDYIRIVRGPEVWKVRGCLVKYYDNKDQNFPTYNVTSKELKINDQLPLRYFALEELPLQYASTYDCPRTGNVDLRIDGINFGPRARVWVGANECPVIASGTVAQGSREEYITCRLPPDTTDGTERLTNIRVESGTLPGLYNTVPYFSYRHAPPAPERPIVTNIGARRVDLVWSPPGDVFDNMMTTGYQIMWFQPQYRTRMSNLTVGNVTTTSIRGLEPDTVYVFAVAAMVEGAIDQKAATAPTDLYGRRDPLPNMVLSPFSIFTNITRTLKYDFDFSFFNANATLNSSGISASSSLGPTGQWGGEGNYGLVIVGSAQIENCNVSSTCCDGYNATLGLASCGTSASVCAVLLERRLAYEYVVDGVTRRQTPSNIPYDDGSPPEKVVLTLQELIANKGAELPTMPCGPALRLTPSGARESGAAWYRRKVNVREGFDTYIKFEISNPSMRCNRLDDVNTYCRSRGADGLAFVIQSTSPVALGLAGSGMGYEGIFNSLAVEVDTFFNYDQMDFYENHISIQTQVTSTFHLCL